MKFGLPNKLFGYVKIGEVLREPPYTHVHTPELVYSNFSAYSSILVYN